MPRFTLVVLALLYPMVVTGQTATVSDEIKGKYLDLVRHLNDINIGSLEKTLDTFQADKDAAAKTKELGNFNLDTSSRAGANLDFLIAALESVDVLQRASMAYQEERKSREKSKLAKDRLLDLQAELIEALTDWKPPGGKFSDREQSWEEWMKE